MAGWRGRANEIELSRMDREKSLRDIGKGAYGAIEDMVKALDTDDDKREAAQTAIREDALSCEVRGGWVEPGSTEQMHAEEFRLLLGTGGPAVRIIGSLDQYGQPDGARLETQDWGTPWTEYTLADESVLLKYAACFYFGEG